MSGIKLTF